MRIEFETTRKTLYMHIEIGKFEGQLNLHQDGKLFVAKRAHHYYLFACESSRHFRLAIGKRHWDWHRDWLDKWMRIESVV